MLKGKKVAVIGAGYGSYVICPALKALNADIVAVATSGHETSQKFAKEHGINHAYDNWKLLIEQHADSLDAIFLAVPPRVQAAISRVVLDYKIPLYAEKLLSPDYEESCLLAEQAKLLGVPTCVGYIFPELHTFIKAKRYLDEGEIGAIQKVEAFWHTETYSNKHKLKNWKTNPEEGGGFLQHFIVHVLYNLSFFLGNVTQIDAKMSMVENAMSHQDFLEADFVYEEKVPVHLSASGVSPQGRGHGMIFYGEKGSLHLLNAGRDPVLDFELKLCRQSTESAKVMHRERDLLATVIGKDSRIDPAIALISRFFLNMQDGSEHTPCFEDAHSVSVVLQKMIETSSRKTI